MGDAMLEVRRLMESRVMPYPPSVYDELGDRLRAGAAESRSSVNSLPPPSAEQVKSTSSYRTYDPEPGSWYVLEDHGGRGYPADMDCLCKKCGAIVDVPDDSCMIRSLAGGGFRVHP